MGEYQMVILIVILALNVFILMIVMNTKKYEHEHKKEISENQFMNFQKFLSDDFANLRENIVININNYKEQTIKEFSLFHSKMITELYTFKDNVQTHFNGLFENLNKNLYSSINELNEKVEIRLNEGFKKTTQTFNSILERISKIDEAQKKIESLSTNIVSLQDVLTDKKTRGTYGEIQLNQILSSIFGDNNTKLFELQKQLSNAKIADAILYTPKPLGNICIDSKFPLENYKRMFDKKNNNDSTKLFKQDIKKHIDDIKNKYIIPNETADSAIMFVPAEAIFAEINAYHEDIIQYSQKNHVWIASPTTLMFLLTTIQVIVRNMERDKYSAVIHEELNRLGEEFKRYKYRWDKLSKNIDQVSKNVKDLHTTSFKIEKRFDSISKVNLEAEELINHNNEEEENENDSN